MEGLDRRFKLQLNGACNPACVVQGEKYRFTVLTSQMIRLEYSDEGVLRIVLPRLCGTGILNVRSLP